MVKEKFKRNPLNLVRGSIIVVAYVDAPPNLGVVFDVEDHEGKYETEYRHMVLDDTGSFGEKTLTDRISADQIIYVLGHIAEITTADAFEKFQKLSISVVRLQF